MELIYKVICNVQEIDEIAIISIDAWYIDSKWTSMHIDQSEVTSKEGLDKFFPNR